MGKTNSGEMFVVTPGTNALARDTLSTPLANASHALNEQKWVEGLVRDALDPIDPYLVPAELASIPVEKEIDRAEVARQIAGLDHHPDFSHAA